MHTINKWASWKAEDKRSYSILVTAAMFTGLAQGILISGLALIVVYLF